MLTIATLQYWKLTLEFVGFDALR